MVSKSELAALFQQARWDAGLTQAEAAKRADRELSAYQNMESGRNSPTVGIAAHYARALGYHLRIRFEPVGAEPQAPLPSPPAASPPSGIASLLQLALPTEQDVQTQLQALKAQIAAAIVAQIDRRQLTPHQLTAILGGRKTGIARLRRGTLGTTTLESLVAVFLRLHPETTLRPRFIIAPLREAR